jgi:hypothetical protein
MGNLKTTGGIFVLNPIPVDSTLSSRRGKFFIAPEFLMQSPQLLMEVMGRCIIIFCRKIENGTLEFWARSMHFDPIGNADACTPPEYVWNFSSMKDDGGKVIHVIASVAKLAKGGRKEWVSCCPCKERPV